MATEMQFIKGRIAEGAILSTLDLNDGEDADAPYQLVKDSWSPGLTRLADDPLAGRLPFTDVVEEFGVHVFGATQAACLTNYYNLVKMIDDAELHTRDIPNKTDVASLGTISTYPVIFRVKIDGGTRYWDARVLGYADGGAPAAVPPMTFLSDLGGYMIQNVTVRFRRIGIWMFAAWSREYENYAINGSFEAWSSTYPDGYTGSVPAGCTISKGAAVSYHGYNHLVLSTGATTNQPSITRLFTGVVAGRTYTVSVYVMRDSGTGSVSVTVGDGATSTSPQTLTSTSASWTRLTFTARVATADGIKVTLTTSGNVAVYYDALMINEGTAALTFHEDSTLYGYFNNTGSGVQQPQPTGAEFEESASFPSPVKLTLSGFNTASIDFPKGFLIWASGDMRILYASAALLSNTGSNQAEANNAFTGNVRRLTASTTPATLNASFISSAGTDTGITSWLLFAAVRNNAAGSGVTWKITPTSPNAERTTPIDASSANPQIIFLGIVEGNVSSAAFSVEASLTDATKTLDINYMVAVGIVGFTSGFMAFDALTAGAGTGTGKLVVDHKLRDAIRPVVSMSPGSTDMLYRGDPLLLQDGNVFTVTYLAATGANWRYVVSGSVPEFKAEVHRHEASPTPY